MIVALGLVAALQITRLRPPDVKFVGTPQNVVEAMLALAKVTPADVVYDLGSGDGRIPITAAKLFGARGVGIEIDPFHLRVARDDMVKAGVGDRVTFLNEDLFQADIHEATVVTHLLAAEAQSAADPQVPARAGARDAHRVPQVRHGRRVAAGTIAGREWPDDLSVDHPLRYGLLEDLMRQVCAIATYQKLQ